MATNRAFWEPIVYSLIRLSPILAPAAIVPLIPSDPILAEIQIKRVLAMLALLITWNMTEGAMILWIKARAEASERTRGFQIATIICAGLALVVLQYLRSLSSQGVFLLILTAISIRGMARSAWENGRPTSGFIASIVGNSLLALIALLSVAPALDWQCGVVALAIGSSVGSVEASWHSGAFKGIKPPKSLPALFRVSVCLGPIIIATLATLHQLPSVYALTCVSIIPANSLFKRSSSPDVIPHRLLRGSAGIYLAFLVIISACKLYESGRLW
jgi:hypothetical protein